MWSYPAARAGKAVEFKVANVNQTGWRIASTVRDGHDSGRGHHLHGEGLPGPWGRVGGSAVSRQASPAAPGRSVDLLIQGEGVVKGEGRLAAQAARASQTRQAAGASVPRPHRATCPGADAGVLPAGVRVRSIGVLLSASA